MASSMSAALETERTALANQGGVMEGTIAVNERPSTPRMAADVRPERVRSTVVEDFPVITGREEEWRFSPLARLKVLLEGADSTARLDWKAELPAGVTCAYVGADDAVAASVPLPADRLSALALSRSRGALVLTVPAGLELTEPVVLHLTGTGAAEVVWGHVVVDVQARARATVVLQYSGDARYAEATSVLVADGAQLDLISVQEWDRTAVHGAHIGVRVGRDARIRATDVTLGGDVVRLVKTVDYTAPGGDAELLGVYLADAAQHLEHRLFLDHSVPQCRSRVTYKGALQGADARTVWVGDVLIRAEAVGTDTYELNRNLLLTPEARADSVPNLEIETGEITGAGHASATGRFDDEQLFYLQSRGIPAEVARRMVVRGFFADVVAQIGVPALEERLMVAVEAELMRVFL